MIITNRTPFETVVTEFQSPLRRYLFYLTGGNAPLSDDIAQETFIKAYINWANFRGEGAKTYLFRIAYRTFIDAKRKEKPQTEIPLTLESTYPTEQYAILNETLAPLDERERTLILLSCVEELSHSDIEEVTALPLGTIKTTLRRAKDKLKKHLKNG